MGGGRSRFSHVFFLVAPGTPTSLTRFVLLFCTNCPSGNRAGSQGRCPAACRTRRQVTSRPASSRPPARLTSEPCHTGAGHARRATRTATPVQAGFVRTSGAANKEAVPHRAGPRPSPSWPVLRTGAPVGLSRHPAGPSRQDSADA